MPSSKTCSLSDRNKELVFRAVIIYQNANKITNVTFKTFLVVLISLGGPRSPAPPTRLVKDQRSLTGCELFNALATSHQRDPFIQSFFLSANLPLIFFPISLIPEWESFPSSSWSNIDSSFFFTKVFSHVRARSPVISTAAKEVKLISLPWKLHDYVIFKKVESESDNVDDGPLLVGTPFPFPDHQFEFRRGGWQTYKTSWNWQKLVKIFPVLLNLHKPENWIFGKNIMRSCCVNISYSRL